MSSEHEGRNRRRSPRQGDKKKWVEVGRLVMM